LWWVGSSLYHDFKIFRFGLPPPPAVSRADAIGLVAAFRQPPPSGGSGPQPRELGDFAHTRLSGLNPWQMASFLM
jgi:hypothetical protein